MQTQLSSTRNVSRLLDALAGPGEYVRTTRLAEELDIDRMQLRGALSALTRHLTAPQPALKGRIRHGLHWSRCHQALARACHRRRDHSRSAAPGTPPNRTGQTTTAKLIYD